MGDLRLGGWQLAGCGVPGSPVVGSGVSLMWATGPARSRLTAVAARTISATEEPLCEAASPPQPAALQSTYAFRNHHVLLDVSVERARRNLEPDTLQLRHELLVAVRPEGQPLRTGAD